MIAIHPAIATDRPISSPTILQQIVELPPSAPTLLAEGKRQYDLGQFREATNIWQKAARSYENAENFLNQALSLNFLSLAYQELGDWQQAEQAIATSLNLLKIHPMGDRSGTTVLAQALNTQGKLQLALGKTEAALNTWQRAEQTYAQSQNVSGVVGSQINQAQALQTLGMYRRAQTLLEQVRQQLDGQPPSPLKVAGLRNLGVVLQVVGDLTTSQAVLRESLAIAQQLHLPSDISATLFSLGNTLRALQQSDIALQFYQQAAEVAPTATARLEAQVNQLSLLIDTNQKVPAQTLAKQIAAQLDSLSASRSGIYARVNWVANTMRGHEHWSDWNEPSLSEMATQLAIAVQQSQQIQDPRAESFALGYLGGLYEKTNQWAEAQELTQKALLIAQRIDATDIAYRWHWQMGRTYIREGNRGEAIAAYTQAIDLLKSLRKDLIAMTPDLQFSFKEAIEPVYRELVTLLVQAEVPSQQELQQARQTIEALQQAEIENFIRSACLNVRLSNIETVDPSAAVFYPIILPDRLVVIFSLPGQPLRIHSTRLPSQTVETTLEQSLESLNPVFSDEERLRLAQQIYDWLIRPAETFLTASHIKTLIFVSDGILRNIPIAALYDGQHYLIEKYGVAITPSLQLLGPQKALSEKDLRVLIGALTESRDGFPALPGVAVETQQIATQMQSTILLNHKFTQVGLQKDLQEIETPVVHLATHGQFSSSLDKTFILTWDKRLSIEGIKTLLEARSRGKNPIELLVLSACETAEGDKRAALGLAGLAVRSGARSTLASLWSVSDESTTELMVRFYRLLTQKKLSKAESLRQSQLELLRHPQYNHPFYWAPFILVGNWM
jgi:CHAT domain-containing protein